MAATPEPFNTNQLGAATVQGRKELVNVAKEWISNIWGLGQVSGDKRIQDCARLVNQTLGQLLKHSPVFQKPY